MRRLASLLLLASLVAPRIAFAQLFGAPKLDPAFCDQPTFRQTVVYVDDMTMVAGDTEWAQRLADKLRATLAPGERLTVVQLSPRNGASHELWTACWPAYDTQARARIASRTFIFQRNPLDALGDQQKLFLRGLNDALARIYVAGRRSAEAVRMTAQSPANKQILRALANDEGRFTNSITTIRAILYSDLAENSDLGSVFQPGGDAVDYGRKLGSYLRRSVFYVFGLGSDVRDDPGFSEQARHFWTAALRSMAVTIGGINSDLNVPNILPLAGAVFPVTLEFNGQSLDGRLSLLTDRDGNLVDSWLGISRLESTVLTGSFGCGAEDDGRCTLDAQTGSGLTTTSPSEELHMTGPRHGGMRGTLGLKGNATLFAITTGPVQ